MSTKPVIQLSKSIRSFARSNLPEKPRKQLGAVWGRFFNAAVRPVLGFLFDVFQGTYKTGGCTFEIPRDQTNANFRACFFLDDYENEERALIAQFVKPTDNVLEYGACIGVVSCTTNRLLAATSKHVVVEGNPLLISTIAKNRVLNHSTFQLVNGLAAAGEGMIPFHIHPEFIVGGSTRDVGKVVFDIEAIPLHIAFSRFGSFNVLIVDVEGAELELFEGGVESLVNFDTIIVEMHKFAYGEEGIAKCRNLLACCGFAPVADEGDTEVWKKPPSRGPK